MAKKQNQLKEYEVRKGQAVDFGYRTDENGFALPDDKQLDVTGLKEEGDVVKLDDETAQPLLDSGVIKPKGSEDPVGLNHDNPEELGYQGDEAKEAAPAQDKPSEAGK